MLIMMVLIIHVRSRLLYLTISMWTLPVKTRRAEVRASTTMQESTTTQHASKSIITSLITKTSSSHVCHACMKMMTLLFLCPAHAMHDSTLTCNEPLLLLLPCCCCWLSSCSDSCQVDRAAEGGEEERLVSDPLLMLQVICLTSWPAFCC